MKLLLAKKERVQQVIENVVINLLQLITHFSTEDGQHKLNLQQLVTGGTTLSIDKQGIPAKNPIMKIVYGMSQGS